MDWFLVNDSFNKEDFTVLEPQVLHRLQNKEKQCRVRFWLLKRGEVLYAFGSAFFGFLVPLDALRGVVFLEVSDNPHLSLRHILNITTVFCFLVKLSNCQMCPLKQLFVRLWNLWPPFALGPGC